MVKDRGRDPGGLAVGVKKVFALRGETALFAQIVHSAF